MAASRIEQPKSILRENFNTMLQSELNITSTVKLLNEQSIKKTVPLFTNSWFVRIAAAIILVTGGVFAGMQLKAPSISARNIELAGLKEEMKEMKEAMLLNLLNEESASERIRAVTYADEIHNPDQKIVYALLNTLNKDKNVNVRIAAVNSVAKFSNDPAIIDSLVSSLGKQTEPLLQIILINILTERREIKSIGPIREIISNKRTLQPVKEIAEKGLKKVI